MTSQQLKAMVAKGKLLPNHPIRRGGEGPWVPAGRVKGLFPDGGGVTGTPRAAQVKKAAPKANQAGAATAKPGKTPPTAKSLPSAQAAATPPAGALPEELTLGGGHGKHPTFNIDQFDVEPEIPITTRRSGSGVPALKKAEQKKITMILLGVIGVGLLVALTVGIIFRKDILGSGEKKPDAHATATETDKASEDAKTTEEKPAAKKTEDKDKWKDAAKGVSQGNLHVKVDSISRAAVPDDVEADGAEAAFVLTLTVKHTDKSGEDLQFDGFGSAKDNMVLKSDGTHPLKVLAVTEDAKELKAGGTAKVKIVFASPAKKPSYLHLELPWSALNLKGMIPFNVASNLIKWTEKLPKAKKTEDSKTSKDTKTKSSTTTGKTVPPDAKTDPSDAPDVNKLPLGPGEK